MGRTCPVCGDRVSERKRPPTYPFCSSRCRTVDLGNWLTERYRFSELVSESDGIDADTPVEEAEEDGGGN